MLSPLPLHKRLKKEIRELLADSTEPAKKSILETFGQYKESALRNQEERKFNIVELQVQVLTNKKNINTGKNR